MLNEKMIQNLNGNVTNIIDRTYTCKNEGNKCFEFTLNSNIYMIYLINGKMCLTKLVLNGSFFDEVDILDNVTIEQIKAFLNGYTENDYNNELCTFEQLTEKTQIKVLRKDFLFLIQKGKKNVTVTELEVYTIIENKASFKDLIKLESCKEAYCTIAEDTVYYFELKKEA